MKQRIPVLLVSLSLLFILLSSCANSGAFLSMHQTSVELSENNYEIIATNISGESVVGYVFGVSYSVGAASQSFGLFRAEGTGEIYKEALENLWENYESAHGSVMGKSIALANVRYDTEMLNLFFYTELKVTVRADVVEFTG